MAPLHKVKIAARLRPAIPGEIEDDGVRVETNDNDGPSFICVTHPRDPTQETKFHFTSCYDQTSTQEEIFEKDVRPLLDAVYSGSTVTVFAYGVTSSGKTHTMQGSTTDPGVIPRAVDAIFDRKDAVVDYNVSISLSYMEIYKDECYDLLVDRDVAPKLPVREDGSGQVFVANLSSLPIDNVAEFSSAYSTANKQRSVGATNLNRASSRSHAILTLELRMVHRAEPKALTGKINLVDLAGSENNKLTGNDSSRMAESAAINKSLSVLGQVVHALNRGDSRIPYRNSKLTRILQDALGGSSVGLLICNIAPGLKFRQDTLNTLNFATRTKNVENKPVINEQDTRPVVKPHFAAVTTTGPRMALLPSLPSQANGNVSGHNLQPQRIQRGPRRTSLAYTRIGPLPSKTNHNGPSRVPRASIAGTAAPYPNASFRKDRGFGSPTKASLPSITEQDIDNRIAKAVEAALSARVEAEVKKRMEALEKQRLETNGASEKAATPNEPTSKDDNELSSHLIAPLLKRHEDLDSELRKRLEELEFKYERNNSHAQFAHVLSPVSRKKTGRAYVALARAHSEKGDLQIALDLYRKAETYVPDNIKLKERIIEIEWAVKNNKPFNPSPKRPKKAKGRRKTKMPSVNLASDDSTTLVAGIASLKHESDDENTVEHLLDQPEATMVEGRVTRSMMARFGTETTNSPVKWAATDDAVKSPPKRVADLQADREEVRSPCKRSRKGAEAVVDNEWIPYSPTKSRSTPSA